MCWALVGFVDKIVNKRYGDVTVGLLENVEDTGQDMSEASGQMGLCMISSSGLRSWYLYDCPPLHRAVESVGVLETWAEHLACGRS